MYKDAKEVELVYQCNKKDCASAYRSKISNKEKTLELFTCNRCGGHTFNIWFEDYAKRERNEHG